MKISFELNRGDFLALVLFGAYKSNTHRKNKEKAKKIVPLVYLVLSILFLLIGDYLLCGTFILVGVLWYFFYPGYAAKKYRNNYMAYVDEFYVNRFGKEVMITFEDDYLQSSDFLGEAKLRLSELREIDETGEYFFLKFSSGDRIILPRKLKESSGNLAEFLPQLAKRLGIPFTQDLNWKWC